MVKSKQDNKLPPIDRKLVTGIDVGGTKVWIADNSRKTIRKYKTSDYPRLEPLLEEYFATIGARPAKMMVGMAGIRDDATGVVRLTNAPWPPFDPEAAAEKYGIKISTANDLVVSAAGMLAEPALNLEELKGGVPAPTGNKLVVTISTGIGAATAFWDTRTYRYVIMASEGGHIGFSPKNEIEFKYLSHLDKKYEHVSIELALSGKHGVDNLIDFSLDDLEADALPMSIEKARKDNRPVGSVLFEYATQGKGKDQQAAEKILKYLGAMLGSALHDLAVVTKASGGVYLTGSIALALGEYFSKNTEMNERFFRRGAVHDHWLKKTPIYLIIDPDVAARGALDMAKLAR